MKPGRDHIGLAVGAVILQQDQVLLMRRLTDPEAGRWSIPSGKVEFGESLERAIQRELCEELGIQTQIQMFLGMVELILPEGQIHWVSAVFQVRIQQGYPRNQEPHKHGDPQWFSRHHLPADLMTWTQRALTLLDLKSPGISSYGLGSPANYPLPQNADDIG